MKNLNRTVFSNGLTLVTERCKHLKGLSIGIWVKVGTRHEKPSEAGISHFLEHMLFKGTEKRNALEIAREIDQVGGEINAFTAREYTCFHTYTLNRDLDLGMDVLIDILLNSQFDAEELERERKVILQEIAMVEEAPEELAHDIYFELLFGKHGLGRQILGSETSIKRMRRADLMRYFKKHYRPDQLVVAVSGDVSHAKIVKKLSLLRRKHWPGRPEKNEIKRTPPEAPQKIYHGNWWIKRATEQVHLVWGVECGKLQDKDRYAAFLMNSYLGGGMSSALFQEIREKNGLAYTVYSSLSPFVDCQVFTIYAACPMKQSANCLKLIENCVQKIQKILLTEEELQMIKDNLKGTILLNSDSPESRMSSIAKNEIFQGKRKSVDEICEEIDSVTPQDIRKIARKILGRGKKSVLFVGPRPSKSVRQRLKPTFPKKYQ